MMVDLKGRRETVAIDRVKPAFLDAESTMNEWEDDSYPPAISDFNVPSPHPFSDFGALGKHFDLIKKNHMLSVN